jgi:hypothetical protein
MFWVLEGRPGVGRTNQQAMNKGQARFSRRLGMRGAFVTILVVFAGATLASELDSASPEAKRTAWIEQSLTAIRAQLTDPGSARFRNVRFFEGGGLPVACGEVTAKNASGDYADYQRFVAAGDTIAALERRRDGFPRLWESLCVD